MMPGTWLPSCATRSHQPNFVRAHRLLVSKGIKFKILFTHRQGSTPTQVPSWFKKSLDLQISPLVGQFKKINAFLGYTICFNETVYDKWCLDISVGQTENDLEHGVVKRWLNSV